ncbi:MAG: S46 family peptidase [Bacteroidota bacterium]
MTRYLKKSLFFILAVEFTCCLVLPAFADDGMWTFDNPPTKQLQEKYNFTPTQEWLDHIRLSSVRFNDGGSGSFVSPNGLVLTNHHVALGQLQKMSSKDKDYVTDGFYAKTEADEIKCPDLELNVLMSMENVSARVQAAVKPGMSEQEAYDAQKEEIAKIAKESLEKTGLRSDVVAFYQGSEHWVYRYKKYTDVRLVMAPEQQIAYFGGDPDNFTYPRYDLDMTLFRVYENDKPVRAKDYLKWNSQGAQDGELVFVSGHPGSTNRLETMSQLEYLRDYSYPLRFKIFQRSLALLKRYSKLGPEQERRALNQMFRIENTLKASRGEYQGLLDSLLMKEKRKEDDDLRSHVNSNPVWKAAYGDAWDSINVAVERSKAAITPNTYRQLRGSRLATLAVQIVEYVTEVTKPNEKRLTEFQDANLASLEFRMFSRAPIYADMEELLFADGLQESLDELGPSDPFIRTVLGGRAPADVARELINGTKLGDVDFRKALVKGGEKEVAKSTDPLIVLARKVDPETRARRQWSETNIVSVQSAALGKIGKARFAAYGKNTYPDATFTLRLSYGTVAGYPMNGTKAPSKTTLYGLYDRAYSFGNTGDFALPKRFEERKGNLDLATPINFVSSCDIIGGNSGSPTINKEGEIVGLIFDGNIESLPGRFLFDNEKNRAVSVHTGAMIECLRKVYDASPLADELEGIVTKTEAPATPKPEATPPAKAAKKKK